MFYYSGKIEYDHSSAVSALFMQNVFCFVGKNECTKNSCVPHTREAVTVTAIALIFNKISRYM